ncbi:MAG TPA: Mur ligase family protein [Thermoanaerobaculia bacterium]|nr:Mur ligase family protein [Thermoanaerobaculia bacterium]
MPPLDSRRLTGPGLLLDRAGAVLDVALPDAADGDVLLGLWREELARLLAALGWAGETVVVRRFPGGANLAFTAPPDVLYAATEVNDQAWAAAEARQAGQQVPPFEEAVARLAGEIAKERNPALLALLAEAGRRGVACLAGDGLVTVGLGAGSRTWPDDALPSPAEVDWSAVHDVPVLLVTGTNGKTTTVRLLAAIAREAGITAGTTSTDRVEVAGEMLDDGDCSGPMGARTLLRDRRVELGILETARGGLLRRGLAIEKADAALVTNIAADHLGEFGIGDLAALAEAKLVVTRVIGPQGRVVLNADDRELAARGSRPGAFRAPLAPVVWFTLDEANPLVLTHLAHGGEAWLLEKWAVDVGAELASAQVEASSTPAPAPRQPWLVHARGTHRAPLLPVADIPLALDGAARFNVANALAAAALADAIGLPAAAIAAGLRRVRPTPDDNPGRTNLLERGGVRILLDYAHNPHGLAALLELAATLPAERRLIILGHAGDREDESIRDVARTAWTFRPDRVIVKELPSMLRGRAPREVPALFLDELRRLGAPEDALAEAPNEPAAVREALAWARPGDLLVLLVHTDRAAVLELLKPS